MASFWCNPSIDNPRHSSLIWKNVIHTLSWGKILTVAATLEAWAHPPSEVGIKARPHVEDVKNIFSNQSETLWLLETWIMPNEMYGSIYMFFGAVCFYVLKHVPICFSCLEECCNPVLLWRSRNVFSVFPLMRVYLSWIFIFEGTYSFKWLANRGFLKFSFLYRVPVDVSYEWKQWVN